MTISTLSRPRIAQTFNALAEQIDFLDIENWPRLALPKRQLKGEFAMELRVVRLLRRRLRAAMDTHDPSLIAACRRSRRDATKAAMIARERWKNPRAYLRPLGR
ncbi:hypothetical protein [Hyphomicrobium sp.]|uniref:hypothetical protein n=1 Tax=Hyphomicrobium sp. TaxID=82 RepID=UPI001E094E24|nr:hypothetical protein [Hyphomicrobium sp.]MBY0561541.1 hypothetical protein [Hyphomicrobium sp.]